MNNQYMKLVSIELTHFARVFAGLDKKKIFIDFSHTDNAINLFVGDNGSGKSSIMGCCHPFAYNSAVGDTTNNSDLIMNGLDGKKVVVYTYGETVYRIQHIYTRKKDGTIAVKSYISKDNEELNDSGTVTTFKNIIYQELGITETFLTLLSIGNRSDGFVEYTGGERKKFVTKIFQELSIFNDYYKNMTNKSRKVKMLLNNVTSKLSKYRNVDKHQLRIDLSGIDIELSKLNDQVISLAKDIGGIDNQLLDMKSISDHHIELQNQTSDLLTKISNIKKNKTSDLSIEELNMNKSTLIRDRQASDVKIATLQTTINQQSDIIDGWMNQVAEYETELNKLGTLDDVSDLEAQKVSLRKELSDLQEKNYSCIEGYTKEYLIRADIYLTQVADICTRLISETEYEDEILSLYEEYKKDSNLYKKIEERFNLTSNNLQNTLMITTSNITVNIDPNLAYEDCNTEIESKCPFKSFYQSFLSAITHTTEENKQKIHTLREEKGKYQNRLTILKIFQDIMHYIDEHKEDLKLPISIFNPDTFIQQYMDDRTVYQSTVLTQYIGLVEDNVRMETLKHQLEFVTMKLSTYTDTEARIEKYRADMESLLRKIDDMKVSNSELLFEFNQESTRYNDICEQIDHTNKEMDYQSELESYTNQITLLNKEMKPLEDKIQKIDKLKENRTNLEQRKNDCDSVIQNLKLRREQILITLNDIENLEKEELIIQEDYDNILAIQEAVSPTKGIPVEFIEFYMRSEMIDKMNDLLDSAFHGRFKLVKEDMVINDKEFRIPYQKNNTIVEDISKASDGERAILTIASSLVLSQLSLDKYNIMLLDEIDTSLDNRLRGKFLDMIERYMVIIHAKQIFLISHNNMFDMHPVNVIMTSDYNISNMTHAHVIRLCD